jgi:hypothetical protein
VPRAASGTIAVLFVASTAVSMWWGTNPTDYLLLVNGSLRYATVSQLRRVMKASDAKRVLSPWFAYLQLDQVLPRGAPLAIVADDQVYTYPLVGENLQRRLLLVGQPSTAGALASDLLRSGAQFILLGPTAKAASLGVSVISDPTRFLPVTAGGPILGGDIYELGTWPSCSDATLTMTGTVNSAGILTVAGRLVDRCGPVAGASVQLFRGDERVPIWQGSDRVIADGTTGRNGTVTFTVRSTPPGSRYFLRAGAQAASGRYHGAAASPDIIPVTASPG